MSDDEEVYGPDQIINVAVEGLLAAAVESNGGVLEIKAEDMKKDYSLMVLAIDFDHQTDRFYISLVDKDDVAYDEDTE